jgi:hypothetical protein
MLVACRLSTLVIKVSLLSILSCLAVAVRILEQGLSLIQDLFLVHATLGLYH